MRQRFFLLCSYFFSPFFPLLVLVFRWYPARVLIHDLMLSIVFSIVVVEVGVFFFGLGVYLARQEILAADLLLQLGYAATTVLALLWFILCLWVLLGKSTPGEFMARLSRWQKFCAWAEEMADAMRAILGLENKLHEPHDQP